MSARRKQHRPTEDSRFAACGARGNVMFGGGAYDPLCRRCFPMADVLARDQERARRMAAIHGPIVAVHMAGTEGGRALCGTFRPGTMVTLNHAAVLTGWPTPKQRDWRHTPSPERAVERFAEGRRHLPDAAALCGWPTPCRRDFRYAKLRTFRERGGGAKGEQLNNLAVHQFTDPGKTASGSPDETEKRAQLNAELSRWLMSFPENWASYEQPS